MKRLAYVALLAALVAGGCQTKPPAAWMPVPLPLEPMPSSKLSVVGTGETPEAAREAAINQMVHQVILPPSEPETTPTSEFVESMIRGYNVAGVARDFLGKYYVTVEMTISQLGMNYQELYASCQTGQKEVDALRQDVDSERRLRRLAEERAEQIKERLDNDRKGYEDRMLKLQAESKLNEQRAQELIKQRLEDEKALKAQETSVEQLESKVRELETELDKLRKAPPGN